MKKILLILLAIGVLAGGYYLVRIMPILTTDNAGADRVVLLHGLGRSEMSMLLIQSALTEAGFDVFNIGYPSTDLLPGELLATVSAEIDDCCANRPETVHFVGHSLGGLLIRDYLGASLPSNLGRVVLLGTPNKGSELANAELPDALQSSLLEMAGPTARALGTGPDDYPASLPAPNYSIGVIAGTRDTTLANKWLPLPNDGLVSVDSASIDGMTDFIEFDVNHWELRTDPAVARQVSEFLLNGTFAH
mgnify:CR=1 FL=1